MGTLLQLDSLVERVGSYVQLRGTAMIPNPPGGENLRSEAAKMLQEVLLRGEAPRGAVIEASGLKERTGRNVLGQLISEGMLVSDTPRVKSESAFRSMPPAGSSRNYIRCCRDKTVSNEMAIRHIRMDW